MSLRIFDTSRRFGSAFVLGVGRLATLAGGAAAGAGLFTDQATVPALVTTIAAGVGGTFLSPRLITAHPKKRPIATVIYLTPHSFLSSILVAELVATSTEARLIEGGALVLWTVGVWWLRPAALGKRVAKWPDPPTPDSDANADDEVEDEDAEASDEVAVVEKIPSDPAAAWWHLKAAKEGGVAPDTEIVAIRQIEDGRRVAAVIASKVHGEPVPNIELRRLSALMNIPVGLLAIEDIPGYGAGVQMLLIGPQPEATQADDDVWNEIARTALPGVQLVEVNEYDLSEELNR
ncbi:hypothetical protein ACM01_14980 [Streptomyces viridochromogenes]|uniref:Uncharacterized protein n=1 Tax=Streptomyces viridochromogenes TaxID=1938 RepID=A0A0J8C8J9_STRVR|nr:hypothetical protein [Streptomyces viridochromogenes]KMS74220.1 hypothetical protein ACM01_14980 [Streptomyces viridochromogenes]